MGAKGFDGSNRDRRSTPGGSVEAVKKCGRLQLMPLKSTGLAPELMPIGSGGQVWATSGNSPLIPEGKP